MRKINQLKAGITLSYFTTGVNFVIHLVYTPMMIRLLGQSEYGLYILVSSITGYLSLFSLGFTGSYLKFYSNRNKGERAVARLNGLYFTIFIIMALICLACGMILADNAAFVFGDKLTQDEADRVALLMRILVVNVSLTFPNSVFDSVVMAHEKFLFQRMLNLICLVFNPLIAMSFLLMGYKSEALVVVTSIFTVFRLVANGIFSFSKLGARFDFRGFDFSLFREMWVFSFFIFLDMIVVQANWSVDKFILGRVSGTNLVAIYGVGSSFFTIYTEFSSIISNVFVPRVNKIASKNGEDMNRQFTDLMIKIGRIQFCVLSLVLTGFIFFGKYFIINIYSTQEYADAYFVALLLMIPATISGSQSIGIEMQRSVNKHQFRSMIYFIMAILNVFVSVPLARFFGSIGAASGTTLSIVIANGIIMNIYYWKGLGINIVAFWKNIFHLCKGLVPPIVLGALLYKFVTETSIVMYMFMVLVYTVIYAISLYCIGLNDYEKNLVMQPVRLVHNWIRRR